MIMQSAAGVVILIAAVAFSIILAEKLKVNPGIMSAMFALIVGVFCGGMTGSAVLNNYKGWYAITVILVTMFFGFAGENGTMKVLAQKLAWKFRNVSWAVPFVLMLLCWICVGLSGDQSLSPFLSPILYSVIISAGIEPVIASIICCNACYVGSQVPWGANWTMCEGVFAEFVGELGWNMELGYWLTSIIMCLAMTILSYAFYTFAGKKGRTDLSKGSAAAIEAPPEFSDVQKKTLILVIVVAVLIIVPTALKTLVGGSAMNTLARILDLRVICAIGIAVAAAMKLAAPVNVFKGKVPWATIITVTGMMMLITTAVQTGVVSYISGVMTNASFVSPFVVKIIFFVVGFALSFVGTGIGTVFPLTGALCIPVGEALGIAPWTLLFASVIGAHATALSPYSTGGSYALIGCPDEFKDEATKKQLLWTGVQVVVAFIIMLTIGDLLPMIKS